MIDSVQPDSLLRTVLCALLRELLEGPPRGDAYVLNSGDDGLLGSLARLPAADASARPAGRSSVAAHVEHVRYGLELLNRWTRGERAFDDADYAASWRRQQVTDGEWRELRETLAREARAWMTAIGERQDWDVSALSNVIGSIAHLAYHLGAIRQLTASAAGPPAND
jgi:hypothetical protein